MDIALQSGPEDQKKAAQLIIDAWCIRFKQPVDAIRKMSTVGVWKLPIGILAYTVRMVTDIDIIPLAEMIGVHPADMTELRNLAEARINDRDGIALGHWHALLRDAGLEQQLPPKIQRPKIFHAPGAVRKEARAEDKRRELALNQVELETKAPEMIANILTALDNLPRERVFSEEQTPQLAHARQIVFAILYYVTLEKRKHAPESLAKYFELSHNTISLAVHKVSCAVRSREKTDFREKVVRVCKALNIATSRLA